MGDCASALFPAMVANSSKMATNPARFSGLTMLPLAISSEISSNVVLLASGCDAVALSKEKTSAHSVCELAMGVDKILDDVPTRIPDDSMMTPHHQCKARDNLLSDSVGYLRPQAPKDVKGDIELIAQGRLQIMRK